jgi:hypothetical protein
MATVPLPNRTTGNVDFPPLAQDPPTDQDVVNAMYYKRNALLSGELYAPLSILPLSDGSLILYRLLYPRLCRRRLFS